MEAADSISSSMTMGKPSPSEESGWSIYIEDFLLSSHNREAQAAPTTSTTATTTTSSSLVMLNRKRKASDDSLEDTSSSNTTSTTTSRKDASELLDMNPWKKGKKGNSAKCMELKMEGVDELGSIGCSELRKKGLCLVPVSSLLHYLG